MVWLEIVDTKDYFEHEAEVKVREMSESKSADVDDGEIPLPDQRASIINFKRGQTEKWRNFAGVKN